MGASHSGSMVIGGEVKPGYETVERMFRKNVATGRERDAQLCVYVDGEKVVDLWGSACGDKSYDGDSLQCVFSSTKAVCAVGVAQLVDRGLLDYHAPITTYWGQFGQAGKQHLRLEDVLRHEAGMPKLNKSINIQDLFPSVLSNGHVGNILAQQTPRFPQHTPREYHPLTAGWIVNEVVRRVTPGGLTLGQWLRRETCGPLGVDVFLGMSPKEESRVRDVTALSTKMALLHSALPTSFGGQVDHNMFVFSKILASFKRRFRGDLQEDGAGFVPPDQSMFPDLYLSLDPTIFAFSFFQSQLAFSRKLQARKVRPSVPDFEHIEDTGLDTAAYIGQVFNDHRLRAGESPGGNAHASARGLAKLAATMANRGEFDGVRILSEDGWNRLHGGGIVRVDASMGAVRTEFTQGGVNLFNDYKDDNRNERILKSGRDGFVGWMGMGGSVMQWSPRLNIGFGYTCTLLTWWDLSNSKARKIQKEVVACAKRRKDVPNNMSIAVTQ